MTDPSRKATVEAALHDIIRPLMEADGGGIELVDCTDKEVVVRLIRACAGCPGAHFTQTGVIEPTLRARLGEDVSVRIVLTPAP